MLNCFIDKQNRVFVVDSLKKASEKLPLIRYEIQKEKILDEQLRWKLKNFNDFVVHYKRVANADISEPLILRSDGFVMDGWHRIIKAIIMGIHELPAKQFVVNPEPDYTLDEMEDEK